PERGGLPIQRCDSAVAAHVLQNGLAVHVRKLPRHSRGRNCGQTFCEKLAAEEKRADGCRTVAPRQRALCAKPNYCGFVAAPSPVGLIPPRLTIAIVSRQRSARPIRSTASRKNSLMESA